MASQANQSTLPAKSGEELKALLAITDGRQFVDLDEFRRAEEAIRKIANYLAPLRRMTRVPEFFAIEPRVVMIDARPMDEGGEVFETVKAKDGKPAKYSFGKAPMMRLSRAGGFDWIRSERCDDRSDPFYAEIEVYGRCRDFDGQVRPLFGRKAADLRDGSGEAKMMSASRLAQARRFVMELAATKAKKRAIADHLALEGSYPLAKIALPFVVPILVLSGDNVRDEEGRRLFRQAMLMNATFAGQMLFGGQSPDPMQLLAGAASERRPAPPPPIDSSVSDEVDPETGEVAAPDGEDPFGRK